MSQDYFGNLPIVAGMAFSRTVLLLDDCEGTFTYAVTGTGGDDVHEYLAAAAFSGTAGLHLKTRTTLAAADDYVSAQKLLSYPETGLLVARLRLAAVDLSLHQQIDIVVGEDDGTHQYAGQLNVIDTSGDTSYVDAAGAAQAIAAIAPPTLDSQWLTVELAIDCKTHTYLHALVNGTRVSLAGIPLHDLGATSGRASWFILSITTAGAAPCELYASHLYVGENLES